MEEKILITSRNVIYVLPIRDIVRCESENTYTIFFLINEEKIKSPKPLKFYEKTLLLVPDFYRIHRSHIVNINFLDSLIKNGFVKLKNDVLLPIAPAKRKIFVEHLYDHIQLMNKSELSEFGIVKSM